MTSLPEVPTDELLNFQDFPTGSEQHTVRIETTNPSLTIDNFDKKEDYKEDNETKTKSFWTLEYYQQFFDIDTDEVLHRIFASINPKEPLGLKLETKPDLYGPFWITITLIFTIAVSGNMASYLHKADVNYHWKYDFHLVSYAATAIISYICIVPSAIWFSLKWTIPPTDVDLTRIPSIFKIMCLYGYSLFIYIPISILWTVQIVWFQWLLVIFAASLSGSVLLLALYPSLRLSNFKLIFAFAIILCHFFLALSFMLYFFHVPNHPPTNVSSPHPLINVPFSHSINKTGNA
ncbi:protein YIPF1 [Agrilus planipennis]|uniref:Protein YIPF n=1 Tax=Agrilus planipennis TaxID=224129 RepID=A0A1W4XTR1_AGRPL|nr:protein YIPF1 [Agrilus planipennis]